MQVMFGLSKFISMALEQMSLAYFTAMAVYKRVYWSRVSVSRAYVVGAGITACNPADVTAGNRFSVSKSTLSFLCKLVGNRVIRSPITSTRCPK